MPHETAAISARSVYTIQPCHFMQRHIRKVYACLAVTCHLHFWQNDRDLLRATAVTRGWKGYQNKSTESRPRRRKFSCCSCRDSNLQPFSHESGTLTTVLTAIPLPGHVCTWSLAECGLLIVVSNTSMISMFLLIAVLLKLMQHFMLFCVQ